MAAHCPGLDCRVRRSSSSRTRDSTIRSGRCRSACYNLARALRTSALAAAVLIVFSRRARAFVRGVPGSALAFYAGALLVAFWLSLGPIITSKGVRVAGDGLYWWFYQHVPGFDGLRVPARMGMLVVLFLAVLGGYGARAIERAFRGNGDRGASAPPAAWLPGGATIVLALAGVLFLIEASPAPIELNGTWSVGDLKPPPVPLMADGRPARHLPRGARAAGGRRDRRVPLRRRAVRPALHVPLVRALAAAAERLQRRLPAVATP